MFVLKIFGMYTKYFFKEAALTEDEKNMSTAIFLGSIIGGKMALSSSV